MSIFTYHLLEIETTHLLLPWVMEKKIAHVNWSRGKCSDVYRTCIVDPSPLKQGQNVTVEKDQKRVLCSDRVLPI